MNNLEKIYSVFAVITVVAFFILISLVPQARELSILLFLTAIAFAVNIGLLFIVFKDIYFRKFANPTSKYIWFALILFLWPTVLIYLPLYGFRARAI